jgi:hypothetical protein
LKKTTLVKYKGLEMPMNRWALFANIDRSTLRTRLKNWEKDRWFEGTEIDIPIFQYFTYAQVDRKLKTNKICSVCELPMKNWRNNSQVVCIYTPAQKKRYKVKESPCQKVARIKRMKLWRKNYKTNGEKIVVDYNTTRRRCLSTLSNTEEHWFDSKGKFNRVCEACHGVDEESAIYNRPVNKVAMSRKQTSNDHNR